MVLLVAVVVVGRVVDVGAVMVVVSSAVVVGAVDGFDGGFCELVGGTEESSSVEPHPTASTIEATASAVSRVLCWSVIHMTHRSYPNGPVGNDELRVLWTPPVGTPWKTAVILSHTRGLQRARCLPACLPAARGGRLCGLGSGTRYMNNNTDCLHEACITDVQNVIHPTADSARSGAFFGGAGHPKCNTNEV